MKKKAQGGMNAAVLVAIISALIIVYIIFLPKSIDIGSDQTINDGKTASGTLLRESPGMVSALSGLEQEKPIPNVFLVERTSSKELKRVNPLIVSNSMFSNKPKRVDFSLDDYQNTENVLLSFTAKKMSGTLAIKLNGEIIFENELSSSVIDPISLDKSLLAKDNTLEFSVSSSGARFWAPNEYSLENLKIVGDINDASRQESANVFALTESEYLGLDRATLKFIPYCSSVKNVGVLEILVNSRRLFSSVPICDNLYRQSIPKSLLSEGENNIVFRTGSGTYSIEQIKVSLEFKQPSSKTYYFEIDEAAYNKIKKGQQRVELKMRFVDDGRQKRAKLDVNGHFDSIDASKTDFSRIISNQVSQGNNYIRIEPMDDLGIVELVVRLI